MPTTVCAGEEEENSGDEEEEKSGVCRREIEEGEVRSMEGGEAVRGEEKDR